MRAILHIGIEKTGTTSIQSFLAMNRDVLKSRSILFPVSPGDENHEFLAGYAANDEKRDDIRVRNKIESQEDLDGFRERFASRFADEVRAAACDTVILSGEHCSSRLVTREEVERLRGLLLGMVDDVRVIVYLRRQDEFLLSAYSTRVRCGETRRLSLPAANKRRDRYDFAKLLDLWSGVFGKEAITGRIFSRATLVDGSAVSDFIQSAGLPADLPYQLPPEKNQSLDGEALELLRMINKHIPYVANGKLFPQRGNLADLLESVSSGSAVMMDPELLEGFMQSFATSNREVADEYFGGSLHAEGDPLFGPAPDFGNRKIPEPISVGRAVEIFSKLWIIKQQQVEELRRRIESRGTGTT